MYESHEYYLRRAIEVSKQSRAAGNTPFGALLVDAEGNIEVIGPIPEVEEEAAAVRAGYWN